MENNIHDKVFACPKCGNETLIPIDGNNDVVGIGYHDYVFCDECGAEFYAEPQYDFTVVFVEIKED